MTKTILIVDDENDIREVGQLALEVSSDWRVLTASSGADGSRRRKWCAPTRFCSTS